MIKVIISFFYYYDRSDLKMKLPHLACDQLMYQQSQFFGVMPNNATGCIEQIGYIIFTILPKLLITDKFNEFGFLFTVFC